MNNMETTVRNLKDLGLTNKEILTELHKKKIKTVRGLKPTMATLGYVLYQKKNINARPVALKGVELSTGNINTSIESEHIDHNKEIKMTLGDLMVFAMKHDGLDQKTKREMIQTILTFSKVTEIEI